MALQIQLKRQLKKKRQYHDTVGWNCMWKRNFSFSMMVLFSFVKNTSVIFSQFNGTTTTNVIFFAFHHLLEICMRLAIRPCYCDCAADFFYFFLSNQLKNRIFLLVCSMKKSFKLFLSFVQFSTALFICPAQRAPIMCQPRTRSNQFGQQKFEPKVSSSSAMNCIFYQAQ